ncbi:DUF1501 domain-containing protein [Jejuia pallidilutea]|uniref:Twin-arginine translocation pathway signal n=1 Tax=Jejuia pallidilutea TaxID=504487 RepID=A0A090VYC8_9FLAO|nr:DUF1501 domain-containing protein [Jejuia pallidilutea]GAL69755.1 twin-arginine translocation pathway signal precursor [Jejuia pallidilutea]
MKRRKFLKLSATASVIGLTPIELQATLKSVLPYASCPDISNRKLVLVNLAGANDGLNTVIPLNQYDNYSALRPNIRVPETGTNKYITLDTTLAANQQIGLHPILTGFKSLYDAGSLRILQSVGYPSQNKSHFKSTDLYHSGNDGNSTLNGAETGWIGRFMEQFYADFLLESYPLAVEIGSNKSLGFHAEEAHGLSLNITGQDPAGFYNILNGLGGAPPINIPDSDYGDQLKFINNTDTLSNTYAEAISNAFNAGQNDVSYPDTDLANQLKTVARLISGDLESKVFMVRISGFDTHNAQVQGPGDILGRHYPLLEELSGAVKAFVDDMDSQNLGDDIVGVTFSEFGRKAAENGNLGTDHGEIAPMFVFGKPVAGGVSGTNPDISEATSSNNFQIQTVQYDYRQTFATLLQDFLGAQNAIIDAAFFNHTLNDSFTNLKLSEILKNPLTSDCYQALSTEEQLKAEREWLIYPNPFTETINFASVNENTQISYKLFNSSGIEIINGKYSLTSGKLSINLKHLSSGVYFCNIKTTKGVETHKLLKI